MNRFSAGIFFVPAFYFLFVFTVHAAEADKAKNPTDSGFKSGDEQACARMLGFTGSAINDAARTAVVNAEACAAYRFLLERNGSGTRGTQCYRSQTDRIMKLNPGFAIGLHKALSEIEARFGGKNTIQSGYRCDGTNGNHPRGCAVDIIWASCRGKGGDAWRCSSDRFDAPEQKWIDQNGKQAPYNIHLRLRYAPEGHHVEPVNTQGCRTGSLVGSGPGQAGAPSSNLSNMLRQAIGSGAPQQAAPPVPQQALPQSQQPTQYFPTSGGQTSGGSTGAYAEQSPISALSQGSQEYLGVSNNTSNQPVSIADQLLQLAYGTSSLAQPQNTATTVPLVLSPHETGSLAVTVSETVSKQEVPFSPVGTLQPAQTFTSSDLAYTPAESPPPRSTGVFGVLENMKQTLLRMLEIVRPMGIRDTLEGRHRNEYAE